MHLATRNVHNQKEEHGLEVSGKAMPAYFCLRKGANGKSDLREVDRSRVRASVTLNRQQ